MDGCSDGYSHTVGHRTGRHGKRHGGRKEGERERGASMAGGWEGADTSLSASASLVRVGNLRREKGNMGRIDDEWWITVSCQVLK